MEIVGGVFLAGLVLWWIIKSDLKDMVFQRRMQEENAKRGALLEIDRREAEAIRRSGIAFAARRERHLRRCQDLLREVQDDQGLVSIKKVSELLQWVAYATWDGGIAYNSYEMICSASEIYAAGNQEHPFPKQNSDGLFRVSEIIQWIEEELRENRRREDQYIRA